MALTGRAVLWMTDKRHTVTEAEKGVTDAP
jgi:hypothetical protein